VVPLVSWELQFEDIPRINVRGDLHILKCHVVATHACKKLLFVDFSTWPLSGLPIFELPLVATAKHSDHSPPLSVTESLGTVVNIKSDLPLIYHPFDLDGLWSVGRIIDVVPLLQELLNISSTKRTLSQRSGNNYNRVQLRLELYEMLRETNLLS
jgi:hypothetical protein